MTENDNEPTTTPAVQSAWNNPRTWDDIGRMAAAFAKSDLVPKIYAGKPANILVAIDYGQRLGLQGLAALQNIGVVNGRPMLWGDAPLAVARRHPDFIDIDETQTGTVTKGDLLARCVLTIKNKAGKTKDVVREFAWEDAKRAGLASKDNWQKYPRRMLQLRARGWAIRDALPDATLGARMEDEYDELKAEEVKPIDATVVDPAPVEPPPRERDNDEDDVTITESTVAPGADFEVKPPSPAQPPGAAKPRKPKHHENQHRKPGRGMVDGDTWTNAAGERFEFVDGQWCKLVKSQAADTPAADARRQDDFAADAKAKALGITIVEPKAHPLVFIASHDEMPDPVKGGLWQRTDDEEWFECDDGETWRRSDVEPEGNYDIACERLTKAIGLDSDNELSLEMLWSKHQESTTVQG
jgi:hypothetical protein